MNTVNPAAVDNAAIARMVQQSQAAAAAGRAGEADQLLARAAQLAPAHPMVLNELGMLMMRQGDPTKAHELFRRATVVDPVHPALWSNLAASLHALNRPDEELEAIERALALEPRHLSSLLQKGTLLEESGETRKAARVYRNAVATLPAGVAPPQAVSDVLAHARGVIQKDDTELAAALEARLAAVREAHGGGPQRRIDRGLDLLTGKRTRFHSEPTFLYVPEVPTVEFFDRAQFPWLDALEANYEQIRTELTNVMVADRAGLEPYVAYPDGVPLDQWRELNRSRRWSAYFLWNQSQEVTAHMARCPRTVELLRTAPQCDVAGRGPTAFFSILDAQTRIPAHSGVTNIRLTVHLPLIVPPGCGFRVGGETREWVEGKAWVFDDTIEHEAWNNSKVPRAILIFDIWNPFLSPAERDMARAAVETVGEYYGVAPEGLA